MTNGRISDHFCFLPGKTHFTGFLYWSCVKVVSWSKISNCQFWKCGASQVRKLKWENVSTNRQHMLAWSSIKNWIMKWIIGYNNLSTIVSWSFLTFLDNLSRIPFSRVTSFYEETHLQERKSLLSFTTPASCGLTERWGLPNWESSKNISSPWSFSPYHILCCVFSDRICLTQLSGVFCFWRTLWVHCRWERSGGLHHESHWGQDRLCTI